MREDMEVLLSQTKTVAVPKRRSGWVMMKPTRSWPKGPRCHLVGVGGVQSVGSIGGCQNALLKLQKTLYGVKNGKSMLDRRKWDVTEEKLSA